MSLIQPKKFSFLLLNTLNFSNKYFSLFLQILFFVKNIFSFVLGGERCLCCGKWTLSISLCSTCAQRFLASSLENQNRCKICGKTLISEIELCSVCRNSPIIKTATKIFPLQSYRLWKKNLLFAWKMQEKRSLSPFFAFCIEQKLRQIESKFSKNEKLCIVPVPPRPHKIKEKGWDQIEELTFYLKNGFNRKIFPILERKTKTQQKKLNRIQRLETIGNSYFPISEKKVQKICKKNKTKILPKTVILLDDVMTTGSTIEDCSKILKNLGVETVLAITLFIVN